MGLWRISLVLKMNRDSLQKVCYIPFHSILQSSHTSHTGYSKIHPMILYTSDLCHYHMFRLGMLFDLRAALGRLTCNLQIHLDIQHRSNHQCPRTIHTQSSNPLLQFPNRSTRHFVVRKYRSDALSDHY